ncbi:MAG: twin-arginine translocase TatA/TatE family subunit [Hyphomicrobiaceae bacterium]|nr:twin-arginine translocase TatA/TatE family subunit [Hyphomicrobiaceae bacterium]
MGAFSIWHWVIVLAIIVLLFGRGRISDIMTDVAEGVKNFKRGMSDEDKHERDQPKSINSDSEKTVDQQATSNTTKLG